MMNATELIEPALRVAKRHALSPIEAAERGLLPDAVNGLGIRALCTERLRHERRGGGEGRRTRASESCWPGCVRGPSHAHRPRQPAALRAPAALLRAGAGATPQVLELLLPREQ